MRSTSWLNPNVMSIAIRIMGLLLAAVAIQFMLNPINAFRLELLAPAAGWIRQLRFRNSVCAQSGHTRCPTR